MATDGDGDGDDDGGDDAYEWKMASRTSEGKPAWPLLTPSSLGSKLHSNECWAYSKTTEKPMHQVKSNKENPKFSKFQINHWYEARIGDQSGKVNRTNTNSLTNKFETNKDVVTRA